MLLKHFLLLFAMYIGWITWVKSVYDTNELYTFKLSCKQMVTEVTADNEIEEEDTSFLLLP